MVILSPVRLFENGIRADLFRSKLDIRRTGLDLESGQAILICKFFTLNHARILHLEKQSTVPFYAPRGKIGQEWFQLAGTLSKNSQKQLLLATQTSSLGRALRLGIGYKS